ncbi:MAG: alginate export family protein [Candidatus Hydrogenedentes bacterium]|nr:alginate export family protein [Candidatus Hydrogenedentota bacterium]
MRFRTLLAVALIASLGGMAFAELQNVEIGGSLRIRGNYFSMDSIGDTSYVEQRTRLNVKADFTQDVSAFIELDSYDVWGEDFRSVYLTGSDFRGGDNVDLYQAYIEARNLWGSPLTARVGRQEITLGNQFLVGVKDVSAVFTGLSFDALRLTFANDVVSIDAIAAKLAESYGDFGDDDVDLYALYGSYLGIEDVTLDAYWMFVRDDQGLLANYIDGTTVDLHTIGLRGAGVIGGFDFELEAAYQFGEVDGVPSACPFGFGEADVDYDEFAINAELGYTFDASWQPRIFARFAYLGGGDPDDSCWSNDYDMPFNRLFSNVEYSEFIDQTALSNVLVYSLGMQAMVTETLELKLVGSYYQADEDYFGVDDELGWEIGFYADYQYSEDLAIRAGYAHFFGQEGLNAALIADNGLTFWPGNEDDDYDYVFLETEISF